MEIGSDPDCREYAKPSGTVCVLDSESGEDAADGEDVLVTRSEGR